MVKGAKAQLLYPLARRERSIHNIIHSIVDKQEEINSNSTMKAPVLVSLFVAFSAASAHSLRGDFEADVVRNLEGECVSGGSSYVGCFEDRRNNRAISYQVDGKGHSVQRIVRLRARARIIQFLLASGRGNAFAREFSY